MQKLQLQQKLQQKLSPQQIQIIRLLELTALEFEERIKQEVVDNPALEESPDFSEEDSDDYGAADTDNITAEELTMGDYMSEDDIPDYKLEADNFSRSEMREEIPFSGDFTFHDMLIKQLGLRELTELQEKIAEYIIGNIDENGYLQRPLSAISDDLIFQVGLDVDLNELKDLLSLIQDFEPAGVGASDLQECLLLQLERTHATPATLLAYRIVNETFDEFTKKHYEKIQRKLNVSADELKAAIRQITTLNPKPGSAWNNSLSDNMSRVIPDFIVESQDGELYLSLTGSNIPNLKISSNYRNMLSDYMGNKKNQTKEKRDALLFVKQKIDAAQWFVDAVKQRQQTLLTTMRVIMEMQKDFFLTGDETQLKPMILKDVAEKSGYDISTISRAANSKYVQTNFGVFSLKYFFSESMQTEAGEEVTSREIKKILQECIIGEDDSKPLSDDKLCELLKEKGYVIARRTVAKYREALGIPVARLRKKI